MSNNIVGIRYVGKKELQEDTVTNSGATWIKDQVNNFSENLAKELLVHIDSFELADPDANADTYIGRKTANNQIEPVAFVNLNSMNAAQLAVFARLQYSRTIATDGRTDDEVRAEVNSLMTNNNLDLEADERKALARGLILEKEVTKAEYEAVINGELMLKLVPVSAQEVTPVLYHDILNNSTPADDLELTADANVSTDAEKPATDAETVAEEATNEAETPTLPELVASLDKDALRAFAKQEGVTYANSMNEDQLRAKLLRDLTPKEAPSISAEAGL